MSDNVLYQVDPHRADAEADILFLHGLGGDHFDTWKAKAGDDDSYWPGWIATDMPNVNVLSLAYPSAPTGWVGDGVEFDTIVGSLVNYLPLREIGRRPFIMITHSLGGLVAKAIVRKAKEAADPREQLLAASLRGIAFLGTPHNGAGLASASVRWVSRIPFLRLQPILKSLVSNSTQLEGLNDWYRDNADRMDIKSLVYREGKRTGLFRVVTASSGHPGLAKVTVPTINRDHLALCKPPSRTDQVYLGVERFIGDCLARLDASPDPVPPLPTAPAESVLEQQPLSPAPLPLPPAPKLFGRDDEVGELIAALLDSDEAPIAVLGQAGIGKSALTLAALQSRQAIKRYGTRRWFVRLDTAIEARAIWTSILTALGEQPGPQLDAQALTLLGKEPGLLVLDNGETPWHVDQAGAEAAFVALSAVPQLKLVVSIRGQKSPYGPVWRRIPDVLDRLETDDARALFVSLAGDQLADCPVLDALLRELDGLPLAIRLMGHLAQGERSVASLLDDYRARRTGPAIGTGKDKSLAATIQLSLDSPQLDHTARRLFAMIGRLPAGLADGHADSLLAGGRAAALALRQIGIAFGDAEGRTRLLAPIRQDAASRPLNEADQAALGRHYFGLTLREGDRIGRTGGGEAAAELLAEIGNLENIVRLAAETNTGSGPSSIAASAISVGYQLSELMRFTGFGSVETIKHLAAIARGSGDRLNEANALSSLSDIMTARSDYAAARHNCDEARRLYREAGSKLGEANCVASLGDIARRRSDHAEAAARYNEALPLYRELDDTLGEANIIKGLGEIALARSDHSAARTALEQALALYRKAGSKLGEVNCILIIGIVALERSDHEAARAAFEEALPIYRLIGDARGEAGCIERLGDLAFGRRDLAAAKAAYEAALLLYRQVGSKQGEANCTMSLGDVALRSSDHPAARAAYEKALELYRESEDILGEANCIKSLGDIAVAESDLPAARIAFEEALARYEKIPEPYSIGLAHWRLTRVCNAAKRDYHFDAARTAFVSIGRDDLVESLDKAVANKDTSGGT